MVIASGRERLHIKYSIEAAQHSCKSKIISQSRYLPFGELLWSNGDSPTDYSYTGSPQTGAGRSLSDIGLMDYNARFYDPMLGRFTSPDSFVPDAGSVIRYNAFAYVANNPMVYTDPSGHCIAKDGSISTDYPFGTSGLCSGDSRSISEQGNSNGNSDGTDSTLNLIQMAMKFQINRILKRN